MVRGNPVACFFPLPLCFSLFKRGNGFRVVGEYRLEWCMKSEIQLRLQ